jgi:talin
VQQSRITSVLTEPQRALLSTISAGHDVIVTAEKELETKAQIPELGSDPVSNYKSVEICGSQSMLSHSS